MLDSRNFADSYFQFLDPRKGYQGANASRRCNCINWVMCLDLCFWICVWIFSDPRKGYLGAIASCWCNCNMIPALRRRLIFVIIFSTIYLYRSQGAWHSCNEPGMIVMKNRSLVIGCNLKIGHCHLDHSLKRKAKKSLTIYRLKRNSLIGNKTEGSDALRSSLFQFRDMCEGLEWTHLQN